MPSVRCLIALCAAARGMAQPGSAPPVEQLARIKRQMSAHLSVIANFTCLETIRRSSSDRIGRIGKSDTLRLEVAYVDGKELFSPLGADKFEDRGIGEFGRGGAVGSGLFASLARAVFASRWPTYRYLGEETVSGRRAFRYAYEIPLFGSGFQLNIGGQRAVVGFSGSFWADAVTLEIMRLTIRADDIPLSLKIVKAFQTIDYGRVNLNGTDFLLPQRADTDLQELSGGDKRNHTEFSHWRRYVGESTLVFDDGLASKSASASKIELPPGLTLSSRLGAELRLDRAAIGDPIVARIDQDARLRQSVVVPAGAELEGRIRAIEKSAGSNGATLLVLEFFELRIGERRGRFLARLSEVKSSAGEARKTGDDGLLGVAALQIHGGRSRLSGDLRLIWKTTDLESLARSGS